MNLSAISHIAQSYDVCLIDENNLIIRLRTGHDIEKADLFFGDRVSIEKIIPTEKIIMEKVASDGLFSYFEGRIETDFTRVCYFFKIYSDKGEEIFYTEYGFVHSKPENRTQYFQYPYLRREYIEKKPDFARDMVLYHIFPDSFADSKRHILVKPKRIMDSDGNILNSNIGGTLNGVHDNIDYLKALGINAIYLNPIFKAISYHKYDTIDYFSIDPCFGTKEDLVSLVSECHKNNIRVILDGVFNHTGSRFFAFQDVLEKGENSKYKDWYYKINFPIRFEDPPNYEAFAYVKEMPKLNTSNEDVIGYFCNVGKYWIKETDIDGWRLDVANEVDHDFWRAFRKACKSVKKDIFLIGEIWEDSYEYLRGDQFDSTMNYRFSDICRDFFAERKIGLKEFDSKINSMYMRYNYSVNSVQMNFLDTHDIARFYSSCNHDVERFKMALFFLIMTEGIPSIFYGDEMLIEGTKESEYRSPMPWNNENNIIDFVSKWIAVRNSRVSLRRGAFRTLLVDEQNEIYIFARKYKEEISKVKMDFKNSLMEVL